jgi:hypothetical protein
LSQQAFTAAGETHAFRGGRFDAYLVDAYGEDTALLIGGALLRYSPDPEVSARAFVTALEQAVAAKKV